MSVADPLMEYHKLKTIALAYFPDEEDADARKQFIRDSANDLFQTSPQQLTYVRRIAAVYEELQEEDCLPDEVPVPGVTSSVECESPNSSECTVAVHTDAASSESSAVSTDVTAAIPETSPNDVASSESTVIAPGASDSTTVSIVDTTPAVTSTPTPEVTDVTISSSASADSSLDLTTVVLDMASPGSISIVVPGTATSSVNNLRDTAAATSHDSADIPVEESVALNSEFTSAVSLYQVPEVGSSSTCAVLSIDSCFLQETVPALTSNLEYYIHVIFHRKSVHFYSASYIHIMEVYPFKDFRATHALVVGWACGPGPPVEVDKSQLINLIFLHRKIVFITILLCI